MDGHDLEFCTSWLTPPGFDKCGVVNCDDEADGSWIETCIDCETHVIVPVCKAHHDFAADALAGIRETVAFGGLLQ